MKVFGILIICLIAAFVNGQTRGSSFFETIHKRCARESGLTEETYAELRKKNDPQLGCLTVCALKKTGDWINNKVDKAHAIRTAKRLHEGKFGDKALKSIENCVDEANKASTDCDKGLKYSKCILQLISKSKSN